MIALGIIGGALCLFAYVSFLIRFALWISDMNPTIYFGTCFMGIIVPIAIAIQIGAK